MGGIADGCLMVSTRVQPFKKIDDPDTLKVAVYNHRHVYKKGYKVLSAVSFNIAESSTYGLQFLVYIFCLFFTGLEISKILIIF